MKKIITLLLLLLVISCAPKSKEQRMMEKMIIKNYDVHGFTDFEIYDTVSMDEVIKNQIDIYTCKSSWDNCFFNTYKTYFESDDISITKEFAYEQYVFYMDQMSKDSIALKYLNNIKDNIDNTVVFTIYKIYYLCNVDGQIISNICFCKFDNEGIPVSIKYTGTSKWEDINDTHPIPGYDYYITSPYKDI